MHPDFSLIGLTFEQEVAGCENIVGIADNLQSSLPAVDLIDLYRHSLVAAVSALDTFVHSLVRVGIILQIRGNGPELDVRLPIGVDAYRRWFNGDPFALREIELQVRQAHSRWTMQFAKDIADAVRLVSSRPAWITIAGEDPNVARILKNSLDVVVVRRNQIVHESDIDPSTGQKWPIDSAMARQAIGTIKERQKQLLDHVSEEYD